MLPFILILLLAIGGIQMLPHPESLTDDYADFDGSGEGEVLQHNKSKSIIDEVQLNSTSLPTIDQPSWSTNASKESIRDTYAQIMKQYMDITAEPCDDFYQYACGNWAVHHPISKDQSQNNVLHVLYEKSNYVLRDILETFEKPGIDSGTTEDSENAELKAKNLYESCINMTERNRVGIKPLLDLYESWGGWPLLSDSWKRDEFDWLNLSSAMQRYGTGFLIGLHISPDMKNSHENIIQIGQIRLPLGIRDYYLKTEYRKKLEAYQRFMTAVMHKMGATKAKSQDVAEKLIQFEIELAKIVIEPNSSWISDSTLHKRMNMTDLQALVPEMNWIKFLSSWLQRKVEPSEEIIMHSEEYIKSLLQLLNHTDPDIVANYLFWRFTKYLMRNLDDRFDGILQTFYRDLSGREENPSRWKECIGNVRLSFGMALGSMFVRKYFDETSKVDVLDMTKAIKQAFRENLNSLDWLDPETKHMAEIKVDSMTQQIGYPDYILQTDKLNKKYANIKINADNYFQNMMNIVQQKVKEAQEKLDKPVDTTVWTTNPTTMNAFYATDANQMKFPAGILQPPLFHRHFPRALTFSGIGMVIGHELTHGFDNSGRQFDHEGTLKNWWSNSSLERFEEKSKCFMEQYGNFTMKGIAVEGEKTAGENIADNGGIKLAFNAYKKWLQNHPEALNDEHMPGLDMTSEQLFFLSYGQKLCSSIRDEAVGSLLKMDNHSPGRFRIMGTLTNSKEFSKVFQCPVGSPMNPEQKCSVW